MFFCETPCMQAILTIAKIIISSQKIFLSVKYNTFLSFSTTVFKTFYNFLVISTY